ncbi:hypothetical protein EPI10_015788 [Gossypium australe]|uniref:Uncharacterized protein n=1 Tax=Gossypium australe TaxID=47621 RepID=A0A5B6VLW0_9ROSI|nr:hypothetical protein EPI10_015788 [Gossypium australe]
MKDSGCFTIPFNIEESYCGKSLCDIGESINLMLMFVLKKLGIGEVRPTTITLQLTNQSLAHLEGKIENALAHFEVDKELSVILGRPFLATRRTLIDVQKRQTHGASSG